MSHICWHSATTVILVLVAALAAAAAEEAPARFRIDSFELHRGGAPAAVPLVADLRVPAVAAQGSIRHDPSVVAVVDWTIEGTVLGSLGGGKGPMLMQVNLYEGGLTFGFMTGLALRPLPMEDDQVLFKFTYRARPDAPVGASSPVEFAHGVGGHTMPLQVVDEFARGYEPEVVDGGATVVAEPPVEPDESLSVLPRGQTNGAAFGSAVVARDINGDGWPDVVIGEPGPGGEGSSEGSVTLIFGPDFRTKKTITPAGLLPGSGYGAALATGDLNGDGVGDVVVGAPRFGGASEGAVFVAFGAEYRRWMQIWNPSVRPGAMFGAAVATVDRDGNGRAEIVIGSPGTGEVWVAAFGAETELLAEGPPGFGTSIGTGDVGGDGLIDLAVGAWAQVSVLFSGGRDPQVLDAPGGAVVIADVDGDGRGEVVAGDPDRGVLRVYRGDPLELWIERAEASPGFGKTVATGNLNDNYCREIIVGAPDSGRAFVFQGPELERVVELHSPGSAPSGGDDPPGPTTFGGATAASGASPKGAAIAVVGAPGDPPGGRAEVFLFGYPPVVFIRGDCDGDGRVGLSDVIVFLVFLFRGTFEPGCRASCDTDADGQATLLDGINVLVLLFAQGGPLPQPFPACGPAPGIRRIDCVESPCQP